MFVKHWHENPFWRNVKNRLSEPAKKRYVWSIKNVKHKALIVLKISSCQYEKNDENKKRYFNFLADPSMLYTGDDIFPDSPSLRERLLCKLGRSLRSLAREL